MKYNDTAAGTFVSRQNRFVAMVERNGAAEAVHVKNTARCQELLLPGSRVMLAKAGSPVRKTRYDLIAVFKEGLGWVNIDSQAPNRVVLEWLRGRPAPFQEVTLIRPEYRYGRSRVDFYLESPGKRMLMEVKGCTLERGGIGYFPDAPTERGVKHLRELAAAAQAGYSCYLAFVIAMPGITRVLPALDIHPEFGTALAQAAAAGVTVLDLACDVGPGSLSIKSCTQARAEDDRNEKGF